MGTEGRNCFVNGFGVVVFGLYALYAAVTVEATSRTTLEAEEEESTLRFLFFPETSFTGSVGATASALSHSTMPALANTPRFGFLPTGSLFALALSRNANKRSRAGGVVWTCSMGAGGDGEAEVWAWEGRGMATIP